ncbi:DAHP synthetase [Trichoderma longibrachiatum ATCC 18648]|uniref:Phospho-2-dehydro-3-deoxyheptonate aldolase n=1 Tax=Trichoderma longibrachiatum ATCC 18648 TaxID=983965 RepID=A0A2T4BXM5_TRILO|nr:DAHP synthetase [Trichoderma longibrachiatum ATCC 18648]
MAQHSTLPEAIASQPWAPSSWRSKPIKQSPAYPDPSKLTKAAAELSRMPPLVHPNEINALKAHLREVAQGNAFLLQGGDCAELFDYCEQGAIESKIKLLLQMSLVLIWGTNKRVVRIGRMAGQYAKPRSIGGTSSRRGTAAGWQCDPMHGNTLSTPAGIKTRRFNDIYSELEQSLRIHKEQGSYLGGVHLELTGEAVTECLGGSEGLDEDDLSTNYTSFCDPRLNEKQALELAFLVADHYSREHKK